MLNRNSTKKMIFFRGVLGYLILTILILLNGCTHVSRKDGPPNFYVDETKIPNAVPRLEPLSKYGNMDHYTVFGKRYYVLRSSRNYQERGIASWYGTKFHSHHTSNGERYNMLAMTAAHKTLPLPTYVQVTNLKNGKQVIVKINDRGPFESNRLIDLSYVAAKKLGMIGHGTTYVDVKAVDPRDTFFEPELYAKAKPTYHAPLHSYTTVAENRVQYSKRSSLYAANSEDVHNRLTYLQVDSVKNRLHAEKLKKRVMAMLTVPVTVHHSAKQYHVQAGPFKDLAQVEHASKRLKSIGLHSKKITET